jgi:hypothetical protein
MLEGFLRFFGEENNAGTHGYSARESGFRFNIAGAGASTDKEKEKDDDSVSSATSEAGSVSGSAVSAAGADSHPHAGAALVIEDPISPQLNLTNNLYKLAEVQKEMCDALERFRRLCVRHDTGTAAGQSTGGSPLHESSSSSSSSGGGVEGGRRKSLTGHHGEAMDIFCSAPTR